MKKISQVVVKTGHSPSPQRNGLGYLPKYLRSIGLLIALLCCVSFTQAQVNPKEIIRKSDEKLRGQSSTSTMKMTIIRPSWTREIQMKSWSKGNDYSLTLVTAPARDKGTAFLKREKEI